MGGKGPAIDAGHVGLTTIHNTRLLQDIISVVIFIYLGKR
jgi:hypothetical protein